MRIVVSSPPHLVPLPGGHAPQRTASPDPWEAAWAEGTPAVVALAFDAHFDGVYATALRILGDPDDAADVAQEVFESLLGSLARVRDPQKLPAFLKACAVRRCLMLLRRRRWWGGARGRSAQAAEIARLVSGERGPDLVTAARRLLAALSPQERAVVVLECVEGHTHAETADLLGTSVATVRRRLDAAKRRAERLELGDGSSHLVDEIAAASARDPAPEPQEDAP